MTFTLRRLPTIVSASESDKMTRSYFDNAASSVSCDMSVEATTSTRGFNALTLLLAASERCTRKEYLHKRSLHLEGMADLVIACKDDDSSPWNRLHAHGRRNRILDPLLRYPCHPVSSICQCQPARCSCTPQSRVHAESRQGPMPSAYYDSSSSSARLIFFMDLHSPLDAPVLRFYTP